MTNILNESKTIRVVADISLVTEIPAKLKKAIENTVPLNAIPKVMRSNPDYLLISFF